MKRNIVRWAWLMGPAVAILVAAATSAVRGEVGSANVGIALAVVVAMAALIGRLGGLTTAAAAALSFNYFHTEPYHSLRIRSAGDAAIVALLAMLGFVVGDLSTWRRQRQAKARVIEFGDGAIAHAVELLHAGCPVIDLWHGAVDATVGGLTEADCRFIPGGEPPGLPIVARPRHESYGADTLVVVPHAGAALPVRCEGILAGHLVVVPRRDVAPLSVDRRVLTALANHIALVISPSRRAGGLFSASSARD